jgi:hypothetical protein
MASKLGLSLVLGGYLVHWLVTIGIHGSGIRHEWLVRILTCNKVVCGDSHLSYIYKLLYFEMF